MEADWEVEIGGGAPVIEADWPGFIDLRSRPERIGEISEAAASPPLGALLLALNAAVSPLWTSKCDLWEPEPDALACYIDLLPWEEKVFAKWQQAETFCREYVAKLAPIALTECSPACNSESSADCSVVLVIRQAIAGSSEGFGITAYLSAKGRDQADAATVLALVMTAFSGALPAPTPPATPGSKLQ
ncbi:MAG TPA: hypothetical protein VGT08_13475 [Terracidiphilus sp.]|nr:hypothetical protein [Terracidiphilus sp.]